MESYLDNSSTTRVFNEVKDIVVETMINDYGNPSSMHIRGVEAEKYVKAARECIAKTLKVQDKEIIFTSGGTEANNMAIIGTAMANRRSGSHIITTEIEHASVHAAMEFLGENGFEITYLPVNEYGVADVKDVENAMTDKTILVSVMYVNNEVGSVMPVKEIGKIIKLKNRNTIFHVDAIQAYGKYHISPKSCNIDLLSVSGHKIHGPKGSGFLYIRDKVKIKPIIYGGGQQNGMRSGTENVSGIAGIGVAAGKVYEDFNAGIDRLYELKDYMTDRLSALEDVKVNSTKGRNSAPHIVNVSFIGVRSEVMLHALEEKNIFVSAGSACSSNKHTTSATLRGMGLKNDEIEAAIRFSFSIHTTKEEIDYAVDMIGELLPQLRRFIRK